MPFRSGAVSYSHYAVSSGQAPTDVDEALLGRLRKHPIRPDACGNGSPVTSGWIAGTHLFDTNFSYESNGFSGALLASMRTDTAAVPAPIKRAYQAMAANDAGGGGDGARPMSRAQRLEAKENAQQRCMNEIGEGLWRKISERPVLWDLRRSLVLAAVEAETPFTQLKGLMQESLGCLLERQAAGRCALKTAQETGKSGELRDAHLDGFVSPPAAVATDEEGAPRKLGIHPEPAWAAGDPLDYMGNLFLLWLWWKCECEEGLVAVTSGGAGPTEVALVPQRLVDLDCAWGVTGAVGLRGDAPTRTPEAARALLSGKMPRRMGFTIACDSRQWQCSIQGDRMAVSSLAIPRPEEAPASQREALEARVESVLEFDRLLLGMYSTMLADRLSGKWNAIRSEISAWIVDRAKARAGVQVPAQPVRTPA